MFKRFIINHTKRKTATPYKLGNEYEQGKGETGIFKTKKDIFFIQKIGYFLCSTFLFSISVAHATSIPIPCPEKDFPTVYKVFESVYICVGKRINTSTIQHAVNVTAEWLDNDNNGIADDIPVIHALQQQTAILVLTQNGLGFFASRRLNHYYQDLYAYETNPKNQRDASQEEIHHLIVNLGWGVAYPDIFSDYSNSKMFQIYNTAEQKGYYHYDDPTCNRACKSVEFHYLGMASYLGAKADVAHDEIRLKTHTALMQKLPEFIRVIESPKYNYPKYKWPTGIYTHTQNIVKLRG